MIKTIQKFILIIIIAIFFGTFFLSIKAHAASLPNSTWISSSVSQGLNPNNIDPNTKKTDGNTQWVMQIWNFSLSLVNIAVAGVLIFLAFVNILRIQVDTYALKKILPTLIISIILANFSLLICRMIVDFSDILTKSFVGSNGKELAEDLLSAIGLVPAATGSITAGLGVGSFSIIALLTGLLSIGAASIPLGIITLVLIFIFIMIPTLVFFILGFLLYARWVMIFLLAAVSPLAFICLVLPSTQGLFRQWWGEFIKWTFMTPVVFFLIRIATLVKPESGNNTTLFAVIVGYAMLYLAIQVPFKMGGAVMSAWGGIGKTLGKTAGGWGLKLADKKFGDATEKKFGKRWSPYGMYAGWKKNADTYWQKHLAETTGTGEEMREGITSVGSKFFSREIGQVLSKKGLAKTWQTQPHAATAAMESISKDAQDYYHFNSPEELKKLSENPNNEETARRLLIANAMAGNLEQGDISKYLEKHDKNFKDSGGNKISNANHALLNEAVRQAEKSDRGSEIYNEWAKPIGEWGGTAHKAGKDESAARQLRAMNNKFSHLVATKNYAEAKQMYKEKVKYENKGKDDHTSLAIHDFLDNNQNAARTIGATDIREAISPKISFLIGEKGDFKTAMDTAMKKEGEEVKSHFAQALTGLDEIDVGDIESHINGNVIANVDNLKTSIRGAGIDKLKNFMREQIKEVDKKITAAANDQVKRQSTSMKSRLERMLTSLGRIDDSILRPMNTAEDLAKHELDK